MSILKSALRDLFVRLLADPTTSFGTISEVQGIDIRVIVPEQFRSLFGIYNSTSRLFPYPHKILQIKETVREWPELKRIANILVQDQRIADLEPALKEEMALSIFEQTVGHYIENFQVRDGFGTSDMTGTMHYRLKTPLFNNKVLESCDLLVDAYERAFLETKSCRLYAPLQGLTVFPPKEEIIIDECTQIIHISRLPTKIILKLREDSRSYSIRGDFEYYAIQSYQSRDGFRASIAGRGEARERIQCILTAVRLVSPPSWLACPIVIVESNLPWLEPSSGILNQNLPWAGFCNFKDTPEFREDVRRYLRTLSGSSFPRLSLEPDAQTPFGYLLWAIKQLENITITAMNPSSRASHLFMALDGLFGKKGDTASGWINIPLNLIHSSSKGYKLITPVMKAAYACRNDLFHKGITPPQRFFQYHYVFIHNLIVAAIRWILDKADNNDFATKDGFIKHVKKARPHDIHTVLTEKPFSTKL